MPYPQHDGATPAPSRADEFSVDDRYLACRATDPEFDLFDLDARSDRLAERVVAATAERDGRGNALIKTPPGARLVVYAVGPEDLLVAIGSDEQGEIQLSGPTINLRRAIAQTCPASAADEALRRIACSANRMLPVLRRLQDDPGQIRLARATQDDRAAMAIEHACQHLRRAGYTIRARPAVRPVDLVLVSPGGTVTVFCAVAAREASSAPPTVPTARTVRHAAVRWFADHRSEPPRELRFDVVEVTLTPTGGLAALDHARGAL